MTELRVRWGIKAILSCLMALLSPRYGRIPAELSAVGLSSYLSYIKLCTLVKRNESMAHTLHSKLKEPDADESKRGPKPQDLIRLYDIILQVTVASLSRKNPLSSTCLNVASGPRREFI